MPALNFDLKKTISLIILISIITPGCSNNESGNKKTPGDDGLPAGTFVINGNADYTNTTSVNLDLTAIINTSKMRFGNSESERDAASWEFFTTSKSWNLTAGTGSKTVYGEFMNANGAAKYDDDTIIFDTTKPGGTFVINSGDTYSNSSLVTLDLAGITDAVHMRFGNTVEERNSAGWDSYKTSKSWTVTVGDELKTVYGEFRSACGLSNASNDTIILNAESPDEVSNLNAVTNGADTVTLDWEDPADVDFVSVEITYSPGGTAPIEVLKGITTRIVDGLTHGTEYSFTVKTKDVAFNLSDGQSKVIKVNTKPLWLTAGGSIATVSDRYDAVASMIVATDSDAGDTITYSIASGSLPPGVTINASTGAVSGDPGDVSEDTDYNFTVNAADTAGDASSRAFSIRVLLADDGSSSLRAAPSAQYLYDTYGFTANGAYWLQPSGLSSSIMTYCLFSGSDGYMLATRIDDSGSNWHPLSSYWDNDTLINPDQSSNPDYDGDIKNSLYTQFQADAVWFAMGTVTNGLVEPSSGSFGQTMQQRFSNPLTVSGTHATAYDYDDFVAWNNATSPTGNFSTHNWTGGGFNYLPSDTMPDQFARARYGITMNNEPAPATADVAIGFGISSLQYSVQYGCGYIDYGNNSAKVGRMFVK